MTMGWLSLLIGCQGCRVSTTDDSGPAVIDLDEIALGEVWLGGEVARRIPLDAVEITTEDDLSLTVGDGYVDLRWIPDSLGETALTLQADGATIVLTAEVVEPGAWPEPLAVPITLEPLDSMDETELGDAEFPATGPLPIAADPITGEIWFGAADQGRAWRMDVFYNHATWAMWVYKDFEEKGAWISTPSCFEESSGLRQDGTCTGNELDADGSIPDNWRFLHGGFVGQHPAFPDEDLTGLSAMITDDDSQRIWLLGDADSAGWMRAIDIGLPPGEGEGDGNDPYTFRQLVPDVDAELGDGWSGLRGGLLGGGLWVASTDTGRIGTLSTTGTLTTLTTLSGLTEAVAVGDTLIGLTDTGIVGVSLSDGSERFAIDRPAGLPDGAPLSAWASDSAGFMVFSELMLMVQPGGGYAMVLPPDGVSLHGVIDDALSGGTAADMALLYVAGSADDGGVLWGASPEGVWYGEPLALPATPRAIGHARDPHDIYIVYAAGSEGCESPELSVLCEDGQRPPVVHALYNPYSLVPPTSAGHPLNLFLSPILETPKDNGLDSDFSQGRCANPGDFFETSCCALDWVTQQRLLPNVAYFTGVIQTLGDGSATTDDDPTIAWGINPTLLRQAYECMESADADDRQAGIDLYEAIIALPGSRSTIANWTHTAGGEDKISDPQNWFIAHAPSSDGYTAPVSDQYEYQLLHDGMSALFDPTRLPAGAGSLRSLDPATLWTPLISGNSLDAEGIYEFPDWSDPDWLTPIRDAPLSLSQPPRSAYYFLSAGVELEVGMTKFRKKELYPLDIRQRTVSWLSTDITAPGVPDPDSGVINIPGMSWEIGTIGVLSEAGAFRETLRYTVDIEEEDWVYASRYVRRLLASSQPEDVKSWYIHIFDVTNPNGLFTENSGVTDKQDITRDTIQRFNDELVAPGYARWALPEDILVEWDDAQ